MNIRRLSLDVDKAIHAPDLVALATAIDSVPGVDAANVTVTEIDIETVGMQVTVEGDAIDLDALVDAIADCGAALHSIDEIVVGNRIIERVRRAR